MRTKLNFWLLAAVLFLGCSTALWGQNAKAYIPVEQLPDLIQCLPAPPAKDSPAFQYDKQRYKWGKQQRKNAERAATAKRDAVWTDEALMTEFSVPFGMELSAQKTPAIWNVVVRGYRNVNEMRVAPKAFYHRIRPFEYFKEPTLTGGRFPPRGGQLSFRAYDARHGGGPHFGANQSRSGQRYLRPRLGGR